MSEILIVGLGNPLVGDDGVGAAVVNELERRGMPEGMRGAVAPDILHLPSVWNGEPEVWLVDAVRQEGEPGAIRVLTHSQIVGLEGTHRSAHQLSLPDGLRWLIHTYPEFATVRFQLWGVEPRDLSPNGRLSPEAAAAVADAVGKITAGAWKR